MIAEVEAAIITALQGIAALKKVVSYQGEDMEDLLEALTPSLPAVSVVFKGGRWAPAAMGGGVYHREASFQLILLVENHRSEEARRRGNGSEVGAYALLEAIEATLVGQTLELEIDELTPQQTVNLYTDAGAAAGLSAWGIEIMTGWDVAAAEAEGDDLTGLHADWNVNEQTIEDEPAVTAEDLLDFEEEP